MSFDLNLKSIKHFFQSFRSNKFFQAWIVSKPKIDICCPLRRNKNCLARFFLIEKNYSFHRKKFIYYYSFVQINTIFFSSKYRTSIAKTNDPRLKKHVTYVLNLLIYSSTFGHIKLITNDVKIMNNIKPNFIKNLLQSILIDSGIGVDKAVRNVDVDDDDVLWVSSPSTFVIDGDAEPSVSLEPWDISWIDVAIELVFSEPGLGTGLFSLK